MSLRRLPGATTLWRTENPKYKRAHKIDVNDYSGVCALCARLPAGESRMQTTEAAPPQPCCTRPQTMVDIGLCDRHSAWRAVSVHLGRTTLWNALLGAIGRSNSITCAQTSRFAPVRRGSGSHNPHRRQGRQGSPIPRWQASISKATPSIQEELRHNPKKHVAVICELSLGSKAPVAQPEASTPTPAQFSAETGLFLPTVC
jgi:hypothetical protein